MYWILDKIENIFMWMARKITKAKLKYSKQKDPVYVPPEYLMLWIFEDKELRGEVICSAAQPDASEPQHNQQKV